MKGKLEEAYAVYRAAITIAEQRHKDTPGKFTELVRNLLHRELARNLMGLRRLVEAELEARRAVTNSLRAEGCYTPNTALMLLTLSSVIAEQGRYAEAGKLARAVIDIYLKMGTAPEAYLLAASRKVLAQTLVNQGRWDAALAEFETIRKALLNDRATFDAYFAGDSSWANALMAAGRYGEAKSIAAHALKRDETALGAKHSKTALARALLAGALARLGDSKKALAAFRKAVPVLLSRRRIALNRGNFSIS